MHKLSINTTHHDLCDYFDCNEIVIDYELVIEERSWGIAGITAVPLTKSVNGYEVVFSGNIGNYGSYILQDVSVSPFDKLLILIFK